MNYYRRKIKYEDAIIGKPKHGSIFNEREHTQRVWCFPNENPDSEEWKAAARASLEWDAQEIARARAVAERTEALAIEVIDKYWESTDPIERVALAEARELHIDAEVLKVAIKAFEEPDFANLMGVPDINVRTVAAKAFRAGYQQCRLDVVLESPPFRRGVKVKDAASQGHATVHGTQEQKKRRWAKYQEEYDAVKSRNPHLSHTRCCGIVAKKMDVHPRTIRRRVKES
ncbi:MAG: hypothetical protein ACOX5J_00320 [Candidatus Hydrogenedentales bacterium]|jgi:hypothetical protein